MTLLIDNYDSFSYNLYQMIGAFDPAIRVVRNDEVKIPEIIGMAPQRVILSPGPGKPSESGICKDVVRIFGKRTPILGVCLGHQAICEEYGATVGYAKTLMHGKPCQVSVVRGQGTGLFAGLPATFQGARYHSLAAIAGTLPEQLMVTALAEDGEIMAVRHREYPVFGLQFHPESILTPLGNVILRNFLNLTT
ncbi:MAG: aminodeoxychorismate/anthranilate synthase component II [Oscillospiraceae bacterium]|jgi:anthranilate synthase component 2|nr:aminodeoxychorismate/anthranilate synthase component II [Oscillospiraceae bacterium]